MTWTHLVDTPPAWVNGAAGISWSLVEPTNVVNAMNQVTTIGLALSERKNRRVTIQLQAKEVEGAVVGVVVVAVKEVVEVEVEAGALEVVVKEEVEVGAQEVVVKVEVEVRVVEVVVKEEVEVGVVEVEVGAVEVVVVHMVFVSCLEFVEVVEGGS